MANFDFKKEYKDLYMPPKTPHMIEVGKMKFICVEGKGNPNEEDGEYAQALAVLYALSYAIKMSYKSNYEIPGYFQYVVPPLEGLWWSEDEDFNADQLTTQKGKLSWCSMIRQPDFVSEEVFQWACEQVKSKKGFDTSKVQFMEYEEGLCVQMLHLGSFDNEPASFAMMKEFIKEQQLTIINKTLPDGRICGLHHEIYLGDPRRCAPEKLKTVLRYQVKQ